MQMLPERFLDKISPEPNTGCWIWVGALNNQNYGMLTVTTDKKRAVLAHRFSYEKEIGEIPKGLELDHKCRITLCVNPRHLEPVTHTVNMRRGAMALRKFCINGHPRTPENTYLRKDRPNSRQCKVCNRIKNRKGEPR